MSYANPNIRSAEVEKRLLAENKKSSYVNDIAQPNPLFKYASVNYLFTLSCLGEKDLKNTKTLLTKLIILFGININRYSILRLFLSLNHTKVRNQLVVLLMA